MAKGSSRKRYRDEGFVAILMDTPMWLVVAAMGVAWLAIVVVFAVLGQFFPNFKGPAVFLGSGLIYVFIVIAFWIALGERSLRRRRLEMASSLYRLRGMSAYDFQHAVGELFRLEDYRVTENKRDDDEDGGVDFEAVRAGKTWLVQVKHKWDDVGVKDLRELWGIVASERAEGAIFVTSSGFSQRAREFAEGKAYRLIDGEEFLRMRREQVRSDIATAAEHDPVVSDGFARDLAARTAPNCPAPGCGKTMVAVTMLRGGSVASQFWSCPDYRRDDPRTHHRPLPFAPYVGEGSGPSDSAAVRSRWRSLRSIRRT